MGLWTLKITPLPAGNGEPGTFLSALAGRGCRQCPQGCTERLRRGPPSLPPVCGGHLKARWGCRGAAPGLTPPNCSPAPSWDLLGRLRPRAEHGEEVTLFCKPQGFFLIYYYYFSLLISWLKGFVSRHPKSGTEKPAEASRGATGPGTPHRFGDPQFLGLPHCQSPPPS